MSAPNIENLTKSRDAERLRYETARLKHGRRVLSEYDVLRANKARRQPQREVTGEDGIYTQTKRLKGSSLGRDLERNYSPAKSMLHQFRVNVVGSLGKIRVNLKGEDGKTTEGALAAQAWFNEDWAKDCDFRDDLHLSTHFGNSVTSAIREGDMLTVFDDNLIEDSGKLLTWEADQIAPVTDALLQAGEYAGQTQDAGLIRDKWGRILAYCTTGKHGLTTISEAEDVTYFKRGEARMFKNPWRLNQGRGVPSILTTAANFMDMYEILSAELATTKKGATQYAYVKRTDAVTDYDDPGSAPEYLPENDGRTSTEVDADGANQSTHTARNYERLETHTGGLTDYLDAGDDVQFPSVDHPNSDLSGFLEAQHGYGGAALGLARAYAILRADSSYTSFRGDMILTWVTFYWLQKELERQQADWVGIKALTWAQRKGLIEKLPDGWERKLSWTWPRMPEVDELDAENATAAALKNGTTDYAALLGPDWEARLEGLAEQVEAIRRLGLPLSLLEGKSGGTMNPKKDGQQASETGGGNE